MTYNYIIYEKIKGLAKIKLNRPEKLNALNSEVYAELENVLVDCERNPEIKVILITGNEKAFGAGADVDGMTTAM
jgi:enoyl-CoA hydratase/carnithine racemase